MHRSYHLESPDRVHMGNPTNRLPSIDAMEDTSRHVALEASFSFRDLGG